ncbi:MAG: energy-coupling factor ABC transporter ATP-binding protein, partial [Aigarchaeota archaeon]|nr:energy-coupling factor ABC transporter ATP-binding protein [Aigarchaeota archaeon]
MPRLEDTAIQLEGVSYRYPDGTLALDGVSMSILKGERVTILGPNGAGKSTLVLHLNGILRATEGDVKVLGMPVEDGTVREIRSRVGVVFQNPEDQLFCPTLREDVAFGPLSMGLPQDEVDERVRWALETVRLRGYEEKAPHHLSVGEMKRAAIATVLAMKPEVLVLDEPTADLDPESTRELVGFLVKLHEAERITLIVATHNVDLATILVDRAFIMSRG